MFYPVTIWKNQHDHDSRCTHGSVQTFQQLSTECLVSDPRALSVRLLSLSDTNIWIIASPRSPLHLRRTMTASCIFKRVRRFVATERMRVFKSPLWAVETSNRRHRAIHLECLLGLRSGTSKQAGQRWMKWVYLIQIWSPVMRNRREKKGGKSFYRQRGRGLLCYSCLQDTAHMRLPNPTGNSQPRGKGKANKGNGTKRGRWGEGRWRESGEVEWMEFRVCVSGGVLWGQFSDFCF